MKKEKNEKDSKIDLKDLLYSLRAIGKNKKKKNK